MAILLNPTESLSASHRKQKLDEDKAYKVNQALATLLDGLDGGNGESFCEDKIKAFLTDAFYKDTNAIEHIKNVDLRIYSDIQIKKSHPVVLIEVKTPSNKSDMPKDRDICCKGMYELVLYYVRQEFKEKNHDVRHLILTNGLDWYIFEKKELYKFFGKKTIYEEILRQDRTQTTDYVYQQVIAPYIKKYQEDIKCTYFSFAGYHKKLLKNPHLHSRELIATYRLLSPTHLLEESLMIDHTQLNRDFYTELLYIMGLHEIADKKVGLKIVRFGEGERQGHSLIEETITTLNEVRPNLDEQETEDIALGLVLLWTNRILFVKLLEGLLSSFEEKFEKILVPSKIKTFHKLDDLFIKVLAKTYGERMDDVASYFKQVPYLNSSLFEYSALETSSIRMRELHQGGLLKPYKQTRLHNEYGGKLTGELDVLEYLLRFLDAYDFSGNEDADESTIINAAVLGKIFEKINGYKDGAFFTPSEISEYMCRLVIRKAVVDKFNNTLGADYSSFEDLRDDLNYKNKEIRRIANNIINNVRVCDPSVGSGHFLVSALNEILVIKDELGILQYYNEPDRRASFDYKLEIINGELTVTDLEHGSRFAYKRYDGRTRRMQRTLFTEKRTIIENCLFGADINSKSVDICRLRLWIELLKNAYYDDNDVLQTLPNIDINIQCGDSLLSMYDVQRGNRCLDISHKDYIEDYMDAARDYKNCDNKHTKIQLSQRIDKWMRFWTFKPKTQPLFDDFEDSLLEKRRVEWMLAYPDVMKEDGTFEGFDVVIGNPPYISISALDKETINDYWEHSDENTKPHTLRHDSYHTFSKNTDIYSLFFERGMQLLKPEGYLCFITSRKWMRNDSGIKTREFITSKTNPLLLVDMPGVQFFEKATVETDILLLTKNEYVKDSLKGTIIEKKAKDMFSVVEKSLAPLHFEGSEPWVIKSDTFVLIEKILKDKSKPLSMFGTTINAGIKTGRSNIFIVNSTQKALILDSCDSEEERLCTERVFEKIVSGKDIKAYRINYANEWLIHIHNGLASEGISPVDINKFPSIKNYLDSNWNEIATRCDQGVTPYNLRDCAYWQDFKKSKIIWGELSDTPKFCLDEKGEYFCNNTVFFMTGDHLIYLLCYLNSPLSKFLFEKVGTTSGQGTLRWIKYKIEQQLVPVIDSTTEKRIEDYYHQYTQTKDESFLEHIYQEIYNFLGLTPEQIKIINHS